jgi:hypothetical protein
VTYEQQVASAYDVPPDSIRIRREEPDPYASRQFREYQVVYMSPEGPYILGRSTAGEHAATNDALLNAHRPAILEQVATWARKAVTT